MGFKASLLQRYHYLSIEVRDFTFIELSLPWYRVRDLTFIELSLTWYQGLWCLTFIELSLPWYWVGGLTFIILSLLWYRGLKPLFFSNIITLISGFEASFLQSYHYLGIRVQSLIFVELLPWYRGSKSLFYEVMYT